MSTELCGKGFIGLKAGCNGDIREGFLEEVVSEERIEERAAVCNVKRGFN